MSLKNKVKTLVENLTGTHIYRNSTLPRGLDFIQDITNSLHQFRADVLFDVGANVGQSAVVYLDKFPNSHIYCFEPVRNTFLQLQEKFNGNDRVSSFQLALGSTNGKGEMIMQGSSDLSFLSDKSKHIELNGDAKTESVEIKLLDDFCLTNKIDRINYLKIDTEGGDLDVLKGGVKMLTEQRIDLIQVEAGMNSRNSRHVPFETLKTFLESREYFLFGIYEQFSERPTMEAHLRRTNPIFVSSRTIEMNKKTTGQRN